MKKQTRLGLPVLSMQLCALVLTALTPELASSAVIEDVEARLLGSGSGALISGDSLLMECRVLGADSGLAVRLFCPLTRFLGDSTGASACFEDCGQPMCVSADSQRACRERSPELIGASCTIDRSPSAVTVRYRFANASQRLHGEFTCQYKQMRSKVIVQVLEPPTTSTATTTTATTTTAAATTAAPSTSKTAVRTTTTATTWTTATTAETTKTTATSAGVPATKTTTERTDATTAKPTAIKIKATGPIIADRKSVGSTVEDSATTVRGAEVTDRSDGWFNAEIMDSLKNGHVLVAGLALLILIIIVLTVSLLCWRRCLTSRGDRQLAGSRYRPAPQGRASTRGSLDGDGADALLMTDRRRYGPPPALPPSSRSRSGVSGGGSRPGSAHSFVSSPIYNEPDVPASAAAGNSSAPDYYNTHNRPEVPSSFLNRSQDGRHSFHSVRPANRQRIDGGGGGIGVGGGGSSELLSGGRGGYGAGATVGVNVGGSYGFGGFGDAPEPESVQLVLHMLAEQGRNIQLLNKQVRASQQALSRLAASYQDLHRSVSLQRVRQPSGSPRNSPIGGRPFGAGGGAGASSAVTPDSSEDPYDAELTGLMLPTAAQMAAEAASMAASANALGDDVDSTDGLTSSASGRAPAAAAAAAAAGQPSPSSLLTVDTISEEMEGEDATLRPKKAQQRQQQQQQQPQQQH